MKLVKRFTSVLLLLTLIPVQGCTNQQTIANLVTVLGNASASIASIEGNTTLATKLQADTAAASTAVLNWKTGTPAQNVIQAINIVEADLNLICQTIPAPQCAEYEPLIILALSTTSSILAILSPTTTVTAKTATINNKPVMIMITNAPKNAKDFKAAWNKTVKANPALARVMIQ